MRDDTPLDVLVTPSNRETGNAYAVLRDKCDNFISVLQSTYWIVLYSMVARANEGTTQTGEGIVFKDEGFGSTKLVALNRNNPFLFDTIDLQIFSFTYDSLRIVDNNSIPIDSLFMQAGSNTFLRVKSMRSCGRAWVPVKTAWSFKMPGFNLDTSASELKFSPDDTGSGMIIVSIEHSAFCTLHFLSAAGPFLLQRSPP